MARLNVSLVIPGLNEGRSLAELAERAERTMRDVATYEIIFVDDGSTDDSWRVICALHDKNPAVKGVRLRRNFGKAVALAAGFRKASGEIIVTMDADLQDDPADLPNLLQKIQEGYDVVVGWKQTRLDPLNRRVLSRFFNYVVRLSTGVGLHDMNCGFKAFREGVVRAVPVYGDLFRFIAVLAAWEGFRVAETVVKHHERQYGKSRYGLERILRGFFDLLTVLFITKYSKSPMHLFGLIGLLLAVIGASIGAYLTGLWFLGEAIGGRPLLLLAVVTLILGIQFFSIGFLGEFLAYLNQKRGNDENLPVGEEIG